MVVEMYTRYNILYFFKIKNMKLIQYNEEQFLTNMVPLFVC